MKINKEYKFWFCPGSVDLYGDSEIQRVTEHCQKIIEEMNRSEDIPYGIVLKETLLSNDGISRVFREANNDPLCAGVITWMHMFSPAKSWISGLKELNKPLLHFHTQFNEEIPYESIDMNFININQSAHGDREYAYMLSRMGIRRKTVVGHWKNKRVQQKIGRWMRSAIGIVESGNLRILRIADNMKNVADTEGDKVEAQLKLGWAVDAFPLSEMVDAVNSVGQTDVNALTDEYYASYGVLLDGRDANDFRRHVEEQARIELGFERVLLENDYQAIVDHFGDLAGLRQLPGLAIQRLMEKGYGFGAEGDWKTAGLLRIVNLMTAGIQNPKGASFFEDYTYNLVPGKEGILQTHMLEISPSVAEGNVYMRVSPLLLGNREDPARLVFTAKEGPAVAASLIDMGGHFRIIVNDVLCQKTEQPMPNLPVASSFWVPQPNFETGIEAWLMTGGAHHTVCTYDLNAEQLGDWAEAMEIETIFIDENTTVKDIKKELRLSKVLYH